MRQFIDADTAQERFAAVSELVGAGRVTELQLQLDRSRTAWTRATTNLAREMESPRQRLRIVEAELRRISEQPELAWDAETQWPLWWAAARRLGVSSAAPDSPTAADATRGLETAIRELEALRQASERRSVAVAIA